MANKARYQNPVIGDTVKLELFVMNSNNAASLDSVNKVEIWYLDPNLVGPGNPDGRTLIETIPGGDVVNPQTGEYYIELVLDPGTYTEIGYYLDIWYVNFEAGDPETTLTHYFQIYPDLWYTTPIPVVYTFDFYFRPNAFRKGSVMPIEIEIKPITPTATDLAAYYENLAIVSNLKISISQNCGDCLPPEEDLRIVVDNVNADYTEKNRAYYKLDTRDMEKGIYDIWFQLDFGTNIYISDKMQFQIY